jgi:hypothetical protein
MDEGPQFGASLNSLDLLKNPFSILGIEPTASPQEISDSFHNAIADRTAPESDLIAAQEILIDPLLRTAAEVSFLLDTPVGHTAEILAVLKDNRLPADLVGLAYHLAPLSKANLLAHVATKQQADTDLLVALVEARADIDFRTIYAKLESTRKAAGLAVPAIDNVLNELRALLSVHANVLVFAHRSSRDSINPLEECTRRILASDNSRRIDALELLIQEFRQKIAPELHQIEERIRISADMLRIRPHEIGLVNPIAESLRDWIELAGPIVELEAHKGRDEVRARQLFNEVRSLAIDLANEHDSSSVALSLLKIAGGVFRSLPRAVEQSNDNLPILEQRAIVNIAAQILHSMPPAVQQSNEDTPVLQERLAEQVIPLKMWMDELSSRTIIKDLEDGGFGQSSIREAKELWDRFTNTARQTQDTDAAELPWILLHGLAIDINNVGNAPVAAKALLEGLINLARQNPPSGAFLDKVRRDLGIFQRNVLEKQVIADVQANQINSALERISELLKYPNSREDRQSLEKLRARLRGKRVGPNLKWGALAIFVAVILDLIVSKKPPPKINDDLLGSQSSENSSRSADNPTPNQVYQANEPIVETKPPAGLANVLSQANIRYCQYQKERFKAIEKDLRNQDEINALAVLVAENNSRCTTSRYQETDLQIVAAEVNKKSEALAAEGRDILSRWRTSPSQPPADRSNAPSVPVIEAPSTTTPVIATPAPAIPDQSSNLKSTSQATPAVDLIKQEAAIATQKRLSELGYFRGPNNGAWGSQSRLSLRSFKVANGLTDDDAFDAPTVSRLYSAEAIQNPSSGSLSSSTNASLETRYAPPVGATLNPLNRSDAIKIHTKLRELGYYRPQNNVLWSAASRDALKDFKVRNELSPNDDWDAATEQRLMSAAPPSTTEDIQSGFAAATGGIWSVDLRACPGRTGGSNALLLKISPSRAETDGAGCEFGNISGSGNSWKMVGTCTVNGETRKPNITLVRTGDELVWSSENGTTRYRRCRK